MTYNILLHRFTLRFTIHFEFVDFLGFCGNILWQHYSIKASNKDIISNVITK